MKNFLLLHIAIYFSSFSIAQPKDTVSALVVSSTPTVNDRSLLQLEGKEIIGIIDSLLELDSIPRYMINSLKNYTEEKRLKEDMYVKLTGFYDSSIYPSSSMYKTWDTYNLYPRINLENEAEEIELVLQDTLNFCHFNNPFHGLITSNFGWRKGRPHNGIDIDLEVNDPVVAAFDGMVRISRHHKGYGRVVIIRHYNGLETLYAHLHKFKVKTGDIVQAGQVIGLGGSSGRSTGSHLHFEVRYRGKPLNPKSIIDFNNNSLICDSIYLKKTKYTYVAVPSGVEFHTVTRGESLYRIAQKYATTIDKLCVLNGIQRNKPLKIGQKILIAG